MQDRNRKKFFFFFTFLLFHFLTFLYSAPHISGKKGEPKVKPKVLPDVSYLRIKGAPRKEIAKALGAIGTKKVAVIIVDFPDQQFSPGWATQANQTFSQFKNYYNEVSYGQLQLDITFFYDGGSTKNLSGNEIPYRMPRLMSYYGQDTNSSLAQLVKDAITATGGAVYKIFYDYVMVLHAGYGNESTNNKDDIWSVYIDWDDAVNGFNDGTIVPEKELGASPVGVTCHEFAHQLGLPDLYYEDTIVGKWCLMDYGVWCGDPQGSQPAHLSAWCKQFLGWAELQTVSSTLKNVQLHYVETISTAVIKIPIITATDPNKEYFLLEYRKKINFDSDLPGEGLLVWRIDDNIASSPERIKNNNINSGIPHYGVDLIEADRTSAGGNNQGDAGDPFPGSKNVTTFFPQEYNITAYNGNPINILLTNIAKNTQNVYFDIISFSGLYATVTRLNGVPLNGVKIELFNNNISTITYTSANGTAVVELSTGMWNVTYSLQNYLTYYDIINIYPEQLTVRNIVLRYDPVLVVSKNNFVIGNNYFDYTTMDKIVFRYNLEGPSDVKIIVYTLTGNVVTKFEDYHHQTGYYEKVWNVRDDNNNELPAGLYFVMFQSKYNKKVDKFVIKHKL